MNQFNRQGREPGADQEPIDLRSVFLGPKAENADLFERLLLEAFRDHVFWRRNFHPEDGFRVREMDKVDPSYERSTSLLWEELTGLLAELKAGVPFFSPRYVGHMCSDLTMASLIGYFATMLYNPNNVAAESSPATTRMELEVAEQLAAMVGYAPDSQWGHLTSGGTVANFEALWVARSVKYLPVALCWAARELELGEFRVQSASGEEVDLCGLDLWGLLNMPPDSTLEAKDELFRRVGPEKAAASLADHSVATLGYQEYGRRLSAEFGDALPPGVVLVPSTAHYSWEKICHALGIGSRQLVHVPVDRRFRMDPDALWSILQDLAERRQPIIGCVAVAGTTEESTVDRVDKIVELRRRAGRELGLAFHLHTDAAWGGYAISITRGEDGARRSYEATLKDYAPELWPEEAVYRALVAIEDTDSITIDPHKLGFVPYPAGAVSFRDRRCRDLVAVEAPYLFHRGASEWGYIGRYIFEGSKPGAAAAGVWMSHKVLPLDARGYGRLVGAASRGALALHRRLTAGSWEPFRIVPLPTPDLNIVCFAASHESFTELAQSNEFVERLYRAMSVKRGMSIQNLEYFVTKTILRTAEYGEAVEPIVEALGFDVAEYHASEGLSVVRCTVMDPFLADGSGRVDFIEGFADNLRRVMEREVTA